MIQTPDVANTQRSKRFTVVSVCHQPVGRDVENSMSTTALWTPSAAAAWWQSGVPRSGGQHWTNRFYLVEKAANRRYFGERWSGD